MKLGWIDYNQTVTVSVPDINSSTFAPRDAKTRTFLGSMSYKEDNSTSYNADPPQCLVIKLPALTLPGQTGTFDRIVMEYRQPSTADVGLKNLA
jgi:hypothetical protein